MSGVEERERRESEKGLGEKRERVLGVREGRTKDEAEAEAEADMVAELFCCFLRIRYC